MFIGHFAFAAKRAAPAAFGPLPPSAEAVAYSGPLGWLIVAWGCWIERHRAFRGATASIMG